MERLPSRERMLRIFEHKDADRIPIVDAPWESTITRWHMEGLPEGMSYIDYFGLDKIVSFGVDTSPRYETKVIEETDRHIIYTSPWGGTLKQWKNANSTPEFLDFTVTDKNKWLEAKARMDRGRDRINWDYLKENYKKWREEGYWIQAQLWFGFDLTHSWFIGTERLLIALVEDPEWCMDIFEHELEASIKLLDMVWEAGYEFDAVTWPDDMGYKHNQFFL